MDFDGVVSLFIEGWAFFDRLIDKKGFFDKYLLSAKLAFVSIASAFSEEVASLVLVEWLNGAGSTIWNIGGSHV